MVKKTFGTGTTTQPLRDRGQGGNVRNEKRIDKTRKSPEEMEVKKQPRRNVEEAHKSGMEKNLEKSLQALSRSDGQNHGAVYREFRTEAEQSTAIIHKREKQRKGKQKESVDVEQCIVFNQSNLVTCGPGLDVRNIIPGFDLCRITIGNLPRYTKAAEVTDMVVKSGLQTSEFYIIGIHNTTKNVTEAVVLTSKERGRAVAGQVDGAEFQGEILSAEVGDNLSRYTMRVSEHSTSPYLTVDWKIPADELLASYGSVEEAQKRCKELNGMFWKGYRIKTALHERRRGSATNSIKIINFPPDATSDEEFIEFIGTDSHRISKAKSYDHERSLSTVRDHLLQQIGVRMDTYEIVASDNFDTTKVKVYFNEWQDVRRAYVSIHHRKLGFDTLTPTLRAWHPRPVQFSIKIPHRQYTAQKKQWDALAEVVPGREVYVQTRTADHGDSIFVHVLGNEKNMVGAMKVRVERLVAGETLGEGCWHSTFLSATYRQTKAFLNRVQIATGIYIKVDPDIETFRVYGEPEMVEDARTMVIAEVERRETLETNKAIVLDPMAVEPSKRETIRRNSTPTSIMGSGEIKHLLYRPTGESHLAGTSKAVSCAVCYNDASNPVWLDCGHAYCAGCMQHFLSSAAETKRFPLVCIGNNARCSVPIPIHLIRQFVKTNHAFQNLVEAAFASYIEQHPQEYRWCGTPDCMQVYCRKGQEKGQDCPSCFSTICAACGEASHEGLTCEERRTQHDPEVIERRNRQLGYRKCPHCNAWIEKTGGCNHVACTCGTHICWKCMDSFSSSEIYTHISSRRCDAYAHVAATTDGVDPVPMNAGRRRRRLSERLAARLGQHRVPEPLRERRSFENGGADPGVVANVEVPDRPRRGRETPGCIVM